MTKDRFAQPVTETNRPRRPARPDPDTTPPPQPASPPASEQASEGATNVASMQAPPLAAPAAPLPAPARVPALTVSRNLTAADLMHGPTNPEADLAQSGVRLPKYVMDALRVVANTSRGRYSMQTLVTEAVKAFLPHEVLLDAWRSHGGQLPEDNPER